MLLRRALPAARQSLAHPFPIYEIGSEPAQTLQYRGLTLVQTFNPDFICYDKTILEIKAVSQLIDEHRAQVLNYLAATGCKPGLIVNFGHYPKMEYERLLPGKHEPVDLHL